jgi:hypothetical protein
MHKHIESLTKKYGSIYKYCLLKRKNYSNFRKVLLKKLNLSRELALEIANELTDDEAEQAKIIGELLLYYHKQ